ncbi:MAG: hypothetical protein KDK64_05140, partial [Chlamydiia bacterium]|nr:hypothetical protein [Chlamydiia bacterium]
MSEISAVGSSGYEAASYASVERKDEEAPAVVVEKAAGLKGEEQQRTQEIFQRAIQPNLRDLDREMELKIRIDATRSPQARFPLLQELIELKAKAFAHTGCSLEEYAKECQKRLEEPSISVVFEGPGKEVKAELFALYALLVGLASNMKNASKFGSYPCPFIKIYEMEKSLGFEIMGNTLLTQ